MIGDTQLEMELFYGDSEHIIVECKLKHRGELHRFTNKAGYLYSAIYQDGIEQCSCERYREKGMIDYWNNERTFFDEDKETD